MLDALGLADALQEQVRQWRRHFPDIDCDLRIEGALAALPDPINIGLYRIVQEALTNVARHARASRVAIHLHRTDDGALRVGVTDNGVGFDPEAQSDGLGLAGMRERVVALGGAFALDSAPGKGVSIEVRLSEAGMT